MDKQKAEKVPASKGIKSEGMREEPNLRRGVVFITPNNEYYRNKNLGFGWAITHETETELTWGEDVKEESERSEYEIRYDFVSREKLIKRVPKLMEDITEVDFHTFYHLLWTLSTHRMVQRMRQEDRKEGGE